FHKHVHSYQSQGAPSSAERIIGCITMPDLKGCILYGQERLFYVTLSGYDSLANGD
ncbi:hypothetical protein Tco_0510364, partial [Tanacetum coccineum]